MTFKTMTSAILVFALAGGALAIAVHGVPAAAQDARMMKVHDRDGQHGMRGPRGARAEMMRTQFEAADADGDGQVTRAEIESYRAAQVARADTSGDGALSLEEFETVFRDVTRPGMVDAFQRLDADGDGQITEAEMQARTDRMMARMDPDGDGVLSLPHGRGQHGGKARTD